MSTIGMTLVQAEKLLDLSRQVHWSYPTSRGRPVLWDQSEEWVQKLEQERDSLVRAVSFLLQNGQEDMATEIAANIWRLWILKKDDEGGRKFLSLVLDNGPSGQTRWRALALYGDSLLAHRQGDIDDSRKRSMEALEMARSLDDAEALCLANLAMSRAAMEDLDDDRARQYASEARRYARNLAPGFGQAPLGMEATAYRMLGDYEKAAALFQESLNLNRRIRDKGMVIAELTNLGLVEIHRNNVDNAEQLLDEAEMTSGPMSDPYGEAMTFLNKAMILYRRGDFSRSRSLLSDAKSTFERSKLEPARDDKSEIDWLDQELKQQALVKDGR